MIGRPSEKQLAAEIPAVLAGLLDLPKGAVKVDTRRVSEVDLLIETAGHVFVVEVVSKVGPGPVVAHAEHAVRAAKSWRRKATPVLAVPYMTEAGRRAAEQVRISWFDLSGNAHIVAPGLRVIVDGRPNRFRAPGRPSSVFAPKSARVVRWLLMHPGEAFSQREIARGTEMSEGFVSRIASRLQAESYVMREASGALRVKDRALLLDAWHAEYRFDRHTIIRGSVAARSGDALSRFVSDALLATGVEHAATGLSAAWQLTHFAAFRIATFFVAKLPSAKLRERLALREEPRGANLWLAVPNDAGVFQGAEAREGVRCVHPVQAYMDLKDHPERASEAAERLRAALLKDRRDG